MRSITIFAVSDRKVGQTVPGGNGSQSVEMQSIILLHSLFSCCSPETQRMKVPPHCPERVSPVNRLFQGRFVCGKGSLTVSSMFSSDQTGGGREGRGVSKKCPLRWQTRCRSVPLSAARCHSQAVEKKRADASSGA